MTDKLKTFGFWKQLAGSTLFDDAEILHDHAMSSSPDRDPFWALYGRTSSRGDLFGLISMVRTFQDFLPEGRFFPPKTRLLAGVLFHRRSADWGCPALPKRAIIFQGRFVGPLRWEGLYGVALVRSLL